MNLFDSGAAYATARPTYPCELAERLYTLCKNHDAALDVGCGTGQLTEALSSFSTVVGIDPSASQIEAARKNSKSKNITYEVADSNHLPDGPFDLITVAQAAHWIDLPGFYRQLPDVAAPEALLALISYGVVRINDRQIDDLFQEFYYGPFHRHWEPERVHVDNGLKEIDFPFTPIPVQCPDIYQHKNRTEFLDYLSTWSALKSPGAPAELSAFADQLASIWPDNTAYEVRWPLTIKAGRIL